MEEQNLSVNNKSTYKSFPFFRILYRNLLLIVIVTVICLALGTAYGIKRVQPVYTAKGYAMLYLPPENSQNLTVNALQKNSIPTVKGYIRNKISGSVSIGYSTDSFIISFSCSAYTGDNAKKALRNQLNKIISAAQNGDNFGLSGEYDVQFIELQNGNDFTVTVTDSSSTFAFIGLIAGIVLGVAIAVLRYLLDNKMKDKNEIEEITGTSLLSYIEKQ